MKDPHELKEGSKIIPYDKMMKFDCISMIT